MYIPKFVLVIEGWVGAFLIALGISTTEFVSFLIGSLAVITSILMLIEISKTFGKVDTVNPFSSGSKWIGRACGNCGYRVKEEDEIINDKCPRCKHYDLDGDVLHYGL